jgi:hypothetical protein
MVIQGYWNGMVVLALVLPSHPNHLASHINPVTTEECVQLERDSRVLRSHRYQDHQSCFAALPGEADAQFL